MSRNAWNSYWRGLKGAAPAQPFTGVISDESLQSQWADFFAVQFKARRKLRLADIACGDGVVMKTALSALSKIDAGPVVDCIGMDFSPAAANALRSVLNPAPQSIAIMSVAADIRTAPFAARSLDLVVSQFGVEYAGREGFTDLATILADGGALLCLCHFRGGAIDKESNENLSALAMLADCGIIELLMNSFQSQISQKIREDIAAMLSRQQRELHGARDCAGVAYVRRLAADLGRLHSRRDAFDARDAIEWLSAMLSETEGYRARMQEMINAALDEEQVRRICAQWRDMGLDVEDFCPVTMAADTPPLAWRLAAQRLRSA